MTGRPKAVAPRGYVTMADAAEQAGVSKATVQRAVARGDVEVQRDESGTVFIRARDVARIEPRPRGPVGDGDDRRAVMLRPKLDRYAAWEEAAGDRPVSTWLGELADKAAKWKG